jgi:hypothetical protein
MSLFVDTVSIDWNHSKSSVDFCPGQAIYEHEVHGVLYALPEGDGLGGCVNPFFLREAANDAFEGRSWGGLREKEFDDG